MNTQELKTFFTIKKIEYSLHLQRLVNKNYYFFTSISPKSGKGKRIQKIEELPPMYKNIIGLKVKPFKNISPIGFKIRDSSDEVKKLMSKRIKIQNEIMRIIKKRVEQYNYHCGLIYLGTSMGKTFIAMQIIEYLQLTTLILVNNKKLLFEMYEKIKNNSNYKPQIYGDGKKEIGFITVMTKTSFLLANQEELADFDCIIVDELHTGFSENFRNKMNSSFLNKDIFLYGLSGTPFTDELDREDLEKYYGKTIYTPFEYAFIPKFYCYDYYHKGKIEFRDWHEYKQLLVDNKERREQQYIVFEKNFKGHCALFLFDRIEELNYWDDIMFEYSYKYYVIRIDGSTKIVDDEKRLKEAREQNKQIVIIGIDKKLKEGFDYDIIDTLFLYTSIKFKGSVIQSIGRTMRSAPGKKGSEIHFWNDLPILNKQREQKIATIKKEYKDSQIKFNYINKPSKTKKDKQLIFLDI